MAYFPNGTSGEIYREQYCERCIHDVHRNCRVWLAHLVTRYSDKEHGVSEAGKVLNILIENNDDIGAKQCSMFIPIEAG